MTDIRPAVVLLVRHADVYNPRRVFYGRLPGFRLSDLGWKQADFLAEHLASEPIRAFYTSPMLRARQTAAVLARRHRGVAIHRIMGLQEVRTSWMGVPDHELPLFVNLYEPPRDPGDETIAQLAERVSQTLLRIARKHPGQVVCCVSHGDPISSACSLFRGLAPELVSIRGQYSAQQCSVTRLTFTPPSEQPVLEYRDVIAELAPELKARR
ncbi:putative broad specificity phosphatase [Cystobacter fuscus DSM 2262]|uniref:Broad specificity phosphatase n=1 Tax=Cystobacter fuscus (strain ATCC 25194 / DSM 2262 / NBRC 100088 / M29) TaxID=1242864 RepID=S9QUN1_CYSF2|nr:histidine phosphatase family protein [Cystobacter fuscus]EPX60363.1 putative broad specificity phosphatase [Cystobacter fuscus DSM 2262]